MKRLLAFAVLLTAATSLAFAGDKPKAEPDEMKVHVGGYWTKYRSGGPLAVMTGEHNQHFVGFMVNSSKSKACEFAISVDRERVQFQIMDEAGNFHWLPVTALLKLKDPVVHEKDCDVAVEQTKGSDAPVAKDAIPAGHRLLYKLARVRAAGELADKEKISRRAAREKIDEALTDAQLHELVTAAGLSVKPQISSGKASDFIDWLLAHQDIILAIVKILLSLFQTGHVDMLDLLM